MFKKFIIIYSLIILSIFSKAQAVDLNKIASDKISEYISNLVPGEGLTEISINLREHSKPNFNILGTREIQKTDNGNYFMQFSLFSHEQNNDERYTGNLGLGKRILSDDKSIITGFNTFLDRDDNGNTRASLGGELKGAVLELTSNYYKGIGNGTDEKVLDGYDFQLTSQLPYLHWANVFINSYKWKGVDRDDLEGLKYGSEIHLSSNLNLELAYDDKDKEGLDDDWYAKIALVHPPRQGSTIKDGVGAEMWADKKDMSGELLSKVKRQNIIMVEFKGSSTISRTD
jgi:hypothetical protein